MITHPKLANLASDRPQQLPGQPWNTTVSFTDTLQAPRRLHRGVATTAAAPGLHARAEQRAACRARRVWTHQQPMLTSHNQASMACRATTHLQRKRRSLGWGACRPAASAATAATTATAAAPRGATCAPSTATPRALATASVPPAASCTRGPGASAAGSAACGGTCGPSATTHSALSELPVCWGEAAREKQVPPPAALGNAAAHPSAGALCVQCVCGLALTLATLVACGCVFSLLCVPSYRCIRTPASITCYNTQNPTFKHTACLLCAAGAGISATRLVTAS